MRKLIMLAAMLALAAAIVVPAFAQLESGIEQETESDDVAIGFDVSNTGDYASQCTPAIQFGNTGNFNNGSSFVQFGSDVNNDEHNHFIGRHPFGFFGDDDLNDFGTSHLDDFEPGGIEFTVEPEQSTDCSNTIQQSSAASGS